MDMIFVSFVDGRKYQKKAPEFSFHLRHCTPAELQVQQSYVRVGKAY